jgi:hypothetical protein
VNKDRYTQQRVIDAIVQARGIKATAAANLKCSRQTVTNYIDRYPAVKAAYEEAVESTIDLAQSKLIVLVEREEWPAIRFLLVTLGKDRGFTERTETSSPTARKGIQTLGGDQEVLFQQFDEEIRKVYGDKDQ